MAIDLKIDKARHFDRLSLALLVVLATVVLWLFRNYGYSWDEVVANRWYGQAVLRFITSLGQDTGATSTDNYYLYGGTFDAIAELLVTLSPFDPRNTRHLANALVGLGGLTGCWMLARRLGGAVAGFWAALFLAVSAPYYGHMFINAKDIPFAAGYVWSLYLLLRLVEAFPSPPLRLRLWFGGVLGLTLGVRVGGVLLLFYLLLAALVYLGAGALRGERFPALLNSASKLARSILTVTLVAYPLMLLCWPSALLHPLETPLAALQATNKFNWIRPMLWRGEVVWPDALPWNFLPVIYGVQLPEVLAILCPVAIVWACWRCGCQRDLDSRSIAGLALLLVAVTFPPTWAIVNRSTIYDNGRQFLFLLPPLMCIAGIFWAEMLTWLGRRRRLAGTLLVGLMIVGLSGSVARMASLHPYEYAFLNGFAGGMPEAGSNYETDYWITAYHEAAAAVLAHAQLVAKARERAFLSMEFSVTVIGSPLNVREDLPGNFTLVDYDPAVPTDYLIATTRWNADQIWPDWPIVAEIGRRGMRFAVVRVAPELGRAAALLRQ